MTTQDFEHISIISMQPKSEQIINDVKALYGLEGVKLINNMYKQDELEKELKLLEMVKNSSRAEQKAMVKYINQKKIKELEKKLKNNLDSI